MCLFLFVINAGKSAYESNLLAILQQEKINLHAIEIELNSLNPQVHLKRLAEQSGGFHTIINSRTVDITAAVRMARRQIEDNLEVVTEDKLTGTVKKTFSCGFFFTFHKYI